jgi:hypothetical protein
MEVTSWQKIKFKTTSMMIRKDTLIPARVILNVKIPTNISVATWVSMYRDNIAG